LWQNQRQHSRPHPISNTNYTHHPAHPENPDHPDSDKKPTFKNTNTNANTHAPTPSTSQTTPTIPANIGYANYGLEKCGFAGRSGKTHVREPPLTPKQKTHPSQ
jgi:hypothetical protein